MRRFCRKNYTFLYADDPRSTVTVAAQTVEQAQDRASAEMDRRYETRGQEPPVSWTLDLIKVVAA